MKLLLVLASVTSFMLGLVSGIVFAATAPSEPAASIAESRMDAHPPHGQPLGATSSELPSRVRETAPARAEVPVLAPDPPPATPGLPSEPSADSAPGPGAQEDETLASRISLDRDEAMRAWLPFRWFVLQQGVDTRALPDDALRGLFDRFIELNERRNTELARLAPEREPDDLESPQPEADSARVDEVEARFSSLEEALALEHREAR